MDPVIESASYQARPVLETDDGYVDVPGILTLYMSDGDEFVVDLKDINDN